MSNDQDNPTFNELLQKGLGYVQAGEPRAAHAIADRLLRDFDVSPESLLFAGEVQLLLGNLDEVEALATRCLETFPDNVNGAILLCRALLALGKIGEASQLAAELAHQDLANERHVELVVTVLSNSGRNEAAWPLARRAAERWPQQLSSWRRLAMISDLTGRSDDALAAAGKALKLNPRDIDMLALRSRLSKATVAENHVGELESVLTTGCRNAREGAEIAYALAKECDDLGQYKRAFTFIEAGAALKRKMVTEPLDATLEMFGLLKSRFSADVMAEAPPASGEPGPVFIVGLPGAGGEEIESLLAAHPEIDAAGELVHFDAAMAAAIQSLGAADNDAERVEKSRQLDMAAIGADYLARASGDHGDAAFFIDRRPLNFMSLGAIRLALPNARVIHVQRDPVEAAFLNFRTLYGDAYGWSYDLDDLARFIIGYRDLMAHWRQAIPGYVLDVDLARALASTEETTREMAEHVGVAWDASMAGAAADISYKPGVADPYREFLEPLVGKLREAGIETEAN